ncbi:hypothetical protein SNOG_06986 [Parastagonospora nodorum SN15]|uniref:Uncharacterized protein n=1 Tax=Phaeosphaeria nodorum (strain SN15 / ATCC MYA-4574 / FGSC 10173) TaxID=321614 RepID=Q0UMM8_PHANO|nr:hypothetical protein SNOG_06986 [Parastagonospora nodorum SN15]EAT85637.1 hypothetical protein SNOG_06986 [Parastagonospora nodorum SN15]
MAHCYVPSKHLSANHLPRELGGLQTFCNVNCAGGASVKQQGTNCYLPISGCAIGSFRVIN